MDRRYVTLHWISKKIGACGKRLKQHFKSRRIKPDFISLNCKTGVGYYSMTRMIKLIPALEIVTRKRRL